MTDTEKRYSQTEKDALSIHWAKNRFSIYLLGAPKFKIITAHKPLLPLFNKAAMRLPPRIEKWVMGMQDVNFELIYEPGKDEADPLDFLSRHPLPETGKDTIERVIKYTVTAEHAVVVDHIKEETLKDTQLQKLSIRILTGDWEQHKKDPDIAPFYSVQNELYVVNDLIFRMNQIIVPTNLQRKVIKAAHHLGHLGMTKNKADVKSKVLVSNHEQYGRADHWSMLRMSGNHEAAQTGTHQSHRHTKETLGCHICRLQRTLSCWSL